MWFAPDCKQMQRLNRGFTPAAHALICGPLLVSAVRTQRCYFLVSLTHWDRTIYRVQRGQRWGTQRLQGIFFHQRYFNHHKSVCEWQLAVGRRTESMWVLGVISVSFLLPDTTARRDMDIRENFNKSLVRLTDKLLTPDYFCKFNKNSQFLDLLWHILTECKPVWCFGPF